MTPLSFTLSRYSTFALGTLLGACLFFLPIQSTLKSTSQRYLNAYGQALADSVARESVEAIFRNDLVSLRAIVQASADNPFVIRVSLRSVEQKTLAQAGPLAHDLPDSALTFESSITLHDSIAGAVTVILDTGSNPYSSFSRVFILVVLTCLVCVAWNLRQQGFFRALRAHIDKQSAAQASSSEQAPTLDTSSEETERTATDTLPCAYLALCVKNASVLEHQLNGETYRRTFKQLENRVQQVGKLYGLAQLDWRNDRYILSFNASSEAAAMFHAACAGRLMLDLAGIIHRVPLDLSAQVSLDPNSLYETAMPFVGLAIGDNAETQALLEGKVDYLNLNDNDARRLIARFCPPYAELLKKQAEQFQAKPFPAN